MIENNDGRGEAGAAPPLDHRLHLVPTTLRAARAFVEEHHRHHKPPQGGIFAVAVARAGEIVGVVIVGRPIARHLQDGLTAEVTRLATVREPDASGHERGPRNACSMLYAAAWRVARALGYRRLVTYTLPAEGGASLHAAGWRCVGEAGGGSWSRKERPRVDEHPMQRKLRWEVVDAGPGGHSRHRSGPDAAGAHDEPDARLARRQADRQCDWLLDADDR